mgnify:CR=1 FL=1
MLQLSFEDAENRIGELKYQLDHYIKRDDKTNVQEIGEEILTYEKIKRNLSPKKLPRSKHQDDEE